MEVFVPVWDNGTSTNWLTDCRQTGGKLVQPRTCPPDIDPSITRDIPDHRISEVQTLRGQSKQKHVRVKTPSARTDSGTLYSDSSALTLGITDNE